MALINRIIGPRDYEVIRDQLGAILALELLNQAAMTYDDLFEAPVYVSRSKPVNSSECPLVIVRVDGGPFENQTVISSQGNYTFFVDVITNEPTTDDGRGDVLSATAAQRLAGVCMGILEDPQYKTLGFTPPFIGRAHIVNFATGTIERGESTDLCVVRVTMNVMSTQTEPGITAPLLAGVDTNMSLNNTENGLVFTFNA